MWFEQLVTVLYRSGRLFMIASWIVMTFDIAPVKVCYGSFE